MKKNKLEIMMDNQAFIKKMKEQGADQGQIDLCKKFIKACWSGNESMPRRVKDIGADLAKGIVEKLFGQYISREAFILAAVELGLEVSPLNKANALIKYRLLYE